MVRPAPAVTRLLLAAAVGLTLTSAGCMKRFARPSDSRPAAAASKSGAPVTRVLTTWRKEVHVGTEATTQKPIPALVGRLYLFDNPPDTPPANPVTGDGQVTVELYDDSRRGAGEQVKLLETWVLDPESLKQMAQKDAVGAGYTLALPWSSYRPDVRQVHVVVRYQPKSGAPLTHAGQVMTLDHSQVVALAQKSGAQPASAKN